MATKKAVAPKKSVATSTNKKPATVTRVVTREPREAVRYNKTHRPNFTNEINSSRYLATLVAEFIGTFTLASAVVVLQGQPFFMLFALAGLVLMFGQISGAYLNPALALAGWATKRLTAARALGYVLMQVLGALLALVVITSVMKQAPATVGAMGALAAAEPFKLGALPLGKEWFVMLGEVLGTMLFGFAVAGATREKNERVGAALTVGIGLMLGLVVGGYLASTIGGAAVLNPAVAFTLQAFGTWSAVSWWAVGIYILGSSLGAVAGFYLYDLLARASQEK